MAHIWEMLLKTSNNSTLINYDFIILFKEAIKEDTYEYMYPFNKLTLKKR
jgi:hypothetical protein